MSRKGRPKRNDVHAAPTRRSEITQAQNKLEPKTYHDWVRLELPEKRWRMQNAQKKGWDFCLLCSELIRIQADLIAGRSTHNCEAGRALEAKIAEQAKSAGNDQSSFASEKMFAFCSWIEGD